LNRAPAADRREGFAKQTRRERVCAERLGGDERRGRAYCRRWARAAIRIFDVGAGTLRELFEQEGALYSQLLDLALDTGEAEACGIVGVFNFARAVLQLDAFPSVGLLDRGREGSGDGCRARRRRVSIWCFALEGDGHGGCCETRRCDAMLDSRRVARKEAGTGYRDDDEYGYVATDVNEDGGGCKGDIHRCVRSLSLIRGLRIWTDGSRDRRPTNSKNPL
jgi:hypothetical protein